MPNVCEQTHLHNIYIYINSDIEFKKKSIVVFSIILFQFCHLLSTFLSPPPQKKELDLNTKQRKCILNVFDFQLLKICTFTMFSTELLNNSKVKSKCQNRDKAANELVLSIF